ncbi:MULTISPECIES: hypothetical protein [unclassified Microcoleus]|uniref:hypothetical protein n=1 Tax=unclassified Microcoleus TaxID=2642155 RepID=UPI002FD67702
MPRLYQKEEGRGKKEEGRGKKEEGRRKKEEGRGKKRSAAGHCANLAIANLKLNLKLNLKKVAKIAEVSLKYAHLSFSATVRDIVEASHNDDCFLTADDSR